VYLLERKPSIFSLYTQFKYRGYIKQSTAFARQDKMERNEYMKYVFGDGLLYFKISYSMTSYCTEEMSVFIIAIVY
jgi:hypothetical protein